MLTIKSGPGRFALWAPARKNYCHAINFGKTSPPAVCQIGIFEGSSEPLHAGKAKFYLGTIWTPLTGARGYVSLSFIGVALIVKPGTFGMANTK